MQKSLNLNEQAFLMLRTVHIYKELLAFEKAWASNPTPIYLPNPCPATEKS